MALNFQYNKTYLQQLNRGLKVRENALPTLQAKEAALRLEVKKSRAESVALSAELARMNDRLADTFRLWNEFPTDLVSIASVKVGSRKTAGITTPALEAIEFTLAPFSPPARQAWVLEGVETLKVLARAQIELALSRKKTIVLEFARKKTTQKVNLYEKVQIPAYKEAILKIKRFLEDDENLAKSSQKILKAKIAAEEMRTILEDAA